MIQAQSINIIPSKPIQRIGTGIADFDILLNGGLVPGSIILFAGQPGVGKSTFLLQLSNSIAKEHKVLYISGEESLSDIKIRADRLEATNPNIFCSESIALEDILVLVDTVKPKLMIVDSLQMVFSRTSKASHGSPTQLKLSLLKLIEVAKKNDITLITIGHSTKTGKIAGFLTLQHMVDITMYMSLADDGIRILEVQKSRFGASQETWEMEMGENGFKALDQSVNVVEGYNYDKMLENLENNVFQKDKRDVSDMIISFLKLLVMTGYSIAKLILLIVDSTINHHEKKKKKK